MGNGTVIAGRYEVLGELGSGAAAIVYRVVDRETRREFALKLLRPRGLGDPESFLAAFHHEFRLLTRLSHPHLVRVHDFGLAPLPGGEGDAPWFTMDLVPGRPVDEVLGPSPDWTRLARIADAVADALAILHREGLVHRDVTCGNILVGEDLDREPPPAWLMDLGLAGRAREATGETFRGTPATVAPETLRAGTIDGRADLYSLGCVLYRLATGQDPFVGRDPWEILRAHLATPPVPPRELNPDVPPSLEELILSLLEKDPARRPPTADAVRERLASLAGREPGRGAPLPHPLAPSFAGRERELDLFREALAGLARGRGEVVLVAGDPGSGRSRLLAEMRLAARLAGRPATLVASLDVPARPFGLADALAARLARERGTPGPAGEQGGDGIQRRVDRLAGLLAGGPGVVLIDDADRIDDPSREVLAGLASRAREGLVPVLLVLVFPGAGPVPDPLAERLQASGPARRLDLRPLEPAATARIAASMLGRADLPGPWERAFHEACGGAPGPLVSLVHSLVDAGRLGPGAPLPPEPGEILGDLAGTITPPAELLGSRWEEIPGAGRAILAALAVAGGEPVAVADLGRLDPRAGAEPEAAGRLVAAGLVRRIVEEDQPVRLALAAPTLAGTILARIPAGEREALHRRMADLLAGDPAAAEVRARHLEAAGEVERALDLLVGAAERALAEGIPREAARIAGEALERAGSGEHPHREAALRRIRAQALAEGGAHGEAEAEFRRALDAAGEAGDALDRAACLAALGAFLGARGRTDEALGHLEDALALLDELGDTAGGGRVLLEIGRLLLAAGRTDEAEGRLATALRQARRAARPDLEAEVLLALGELASRSGRGDEAGDHYRAAENAAQRAGVPAARAAARRGRILALMASGRIPEAIAETEQWLDQARQAGSLAAEAEARALAGRLAARGGRRGEALAQLDRAIELRRRLGQATEAAALMAEAAGLLLERGQPRAARLRAEEARSLAHRVGAPGAARQAELTLARIDAFLGDPAGTGSHLEAAEAGPAERSLLLGRAHLAAGQADRAREALQEACFLARRGRLPAIEEEGLALLAEAYLVLREDERALLALRKLRAAARAPDPEAAAHARLVAAERELALPDGDMALARDEAERAAETLAERERGDLAWRAFAALAAAARRLGDVDLARRASGEAFRRLDGLLVALPDGQRERWERNPRVRAVLESPDAGATTPEAPGTAAPAGDLARRVEVLERLLEINRALNSTLELGPLLRTLLDTALELTGAERGFLLLEQGGNAAMEVARGEGGADLAGPDREMSRSVARQVMREGKPLLAHDAQADPRLAASRSVHALRIRSILATPLRVRGRVAGALVLDSRSVAGMFGPESQEILVRLADQAGIALANARLVDELRRQAEEIRRLNERLRETIEEQKIEILEKQSNLEVRFRFDCMIGASPAMQRVYRSLEKILETEIPVLVTGESGTGKDLVARVLHYNGPRREKRFVTVNCAALTDTLLESELFGHRRGAFTGADRDRKGLFEQADGGTLFLDEIGELPLHLQPKLLRAIQFGEIRRVGEDAPRHVDVRIVAATNRDLARAVEEGKFREDLFYRLDVARIHLPPLRERLEDIGLLVEHFLEEAARRAGTAPKRIEPAALRLFLRHDWPGNVRELENEVLKLATFSEGEVITEVDVLENATFLARRGRRPAGPSPAAGEVEVPTLEQAEIEQIRQALRAAKGNRTRAARMLGIDRSTLYRKLKRLRDQLGEEF